jgi:hypothetical protein
MKVSIYCLLNARIISVLEEGRCINSVHAKNIMSQKYKEICDQHTFNMMQMPCSMSVLEQKI